MRFPLLSLLARDAEDRIARTRLNHRANTVASFVAAMFATTAPGAAQMRVELTPFAGRYAPTADLFPAGTLACFYSGSFQNMSQAAGPALGGRVTAWLTGRVAIDGSFGYSGSGAVLREYPFCQECSYAYDSVVASNTTGHVWMVSARVLLVVGPHPSSTTFYILGGPAYIGHGDQDLNLFPGTKFHDGVAMTSTSPGAVIGIGARFKIPRTALAVRTDLEDYLYVARFSGQNGGYSWSSSQFQRDLLLSLGLSVLPAR